MPLKHTFILTAHLLCAPASTALEPKRLPIHSPTSFHLPASPRPHSCLAKPTSQHNCSFRNTLVSLSHFPPGRTLTMTKPNHALTLHLPELLLFAEETTEHTPSVLIPNGPRRSLNFPAVENRKPTFPEPRGGLPKPNTAYRPGGPRRARTRRI